MLEELFEDEHEMPHLDRAEQAIELIEFQR